MKINKTQIEMFYDAHDEAHMQNCRKLLVMAEQSTDANKIRIAKANLSDAVTRIPTSELLRRKNAAISQQAAKLN